MSFIRTPTRLGVVTAAMAGLLALGAGVASAHVSVSSADATPGGFGKVTFRVPNESETAGTTKVRIQLPAKDPLASVSVLPVPGWTIVPTPVLELAPAAPSAAGRPAASTSPSSGPALPLSDVALVVAVAAVVLALLGRRRTVSP